MNSAELEMSVIGCIVTSSDALQTAAAELVPGDFIDEHCKAAYDAALTLFMQGKPVDPVILSEKLDETGRQFLYNCYQITPSTANAKGYIEGVKESSLRRRINAGVEEIQQLYYSGASSIEMLDGMNSILQNQPMGINVTTAEQAADTFLAEKDEELKNGRQKSINSGFYKLDALLHGFSSGGLYIVGGRSSMGKTALALSMALSAGRSGKKVLIISLEMEATGLASRFISMTTQVKHDALERGKYTDEQRKHIEVQKATGTFRNICICDTAEMSVAQIRALISQKHPEIVFIDYLGLIRAEKAESRQVQVATVTRQLKAAAKDYKIPIVCLSQLNRDVEKEKDHRPKLSDLRESGAIEQDADAVLFIYRAGYYDSKAPQNEAQIIVAKNRQGATGAVNIFWDAERVYYKDVDTVHTAPPGYGPKSNNDIEEL